MEEHAKEYVWGVKGPQRVANKYSIKTLIKNILLEQSGFDPNNPAHQDAWERMQEPPTEPGIDIHSMMQRQKQIDEEIIKKEKMDEEINATEKQIKNTQSILSTLNDDIKKADYEEKIFTHPTMLFRYSAITFNGHRIHYDYPYSTKEEGYKDLVFHGPLQATLLLRAAEKYKKAKAHFFSHRGVAPVYANDNLFINIEKPSKVSTSITFSLIDFIFL